MLHAIDLTLLAIFLVLLAFSIFIAYQQVTLWEVPKALAVYATFTTLLGWQNNLKMYLLVSLPCQIVVLSVLIYAQLYITLTYTVVLTIVCLVGTFLMRRYNPAVKKFI